MTSQDRESPQRRLCNFKGKGTERNKKSQNSWCRRQNQNQRKKESEAEKGKENASENENAVPIESKDTEKAKPKNANKRKATTVKDKCEKPVKKVPVK